MSNHLEEFGLPILAGAFQKSVEVAPWLRHMVTGHAGRVVVDHSNPSAPAEPGNEEQRIRTIETPLLFQNINRGLALA